MNLQTSLKKHNYKSFVHQFFFFSAGHCMCTYWRSGKGIHSKKLQPMSLIDSSCYHTSMLRMSLVNMLTGASFDRIMQNNQIGRCQKDGKIFLKETFRPLLVNGMSPTHRHTHRGWTCQVLVNRNFGLPLPLPLMEEE